MGVSQEQDARILLHGDGPGECRNTIEASVLFMEAERRADKIGAYHTRGFAQKRLAELYADNYDKEESLAYSQKAIRSFILSGDSLCVDICRIYIAQYFYKKSQLDKAEAIVDSLLQPENTPDAIIQAYASSLKGNIFFAREEWEKALQCYSIREKLGYELTIGGLGNSAYIQEKMGHPHRADSLMEVAKERIATAIDSTIYYSCAKDLYLLRKDYPKAYEALETEFSYQNKSVSFILSRSATHAQKSFYEDHYHLEQERNRNLVLDTLVAILFFTAAIVLLIRALRRRKREIELEREVVLSLKKDLLVLQEEQKAAGVVVDSFLQDRIDRIRQLSGTYFYWTDEVMSLRQSQQVSGMTKEVIEEFRNELRELRGDPHFFFNIEKALDLAHDRLMQRLRSAIFQTQSLKYDEDDFRMLALFFANFSSKSISFIMDMKDDAVRKRKSRYKKQFMEQGEAFLEFLEYLL